MVGQIQVIDVPDLEAARRAILAQSKALLAAADACQPRMVQRGGGARGIEVRLFPRTRNGDMLVVHLLFDTRDAMGANLINSAVETLAPRIAALAGGTANLRILSNLTDQRLATARCVIPTAVLACEGMSGAEVARRIEAANTLARVDPYRAATHNKGIMNGVDAVAIATGNDWRALEAGAHAYAAGDGQYRALTGWRVERDGSLSGALTLPLAVGTVGGATRVHPTAQVALKILGVASAAGLAQVMVSVGLAQNLAALRALVTSGIQTGHMQMHARQVALAAGATGDDVDAVSAQLIADGAIRLDHAEALLAEM
jgi:hydroxymethylglutaryl-CoA reductase